MLPLGVRGVDEFEVTVGEAGDEVAEEENAEDGCVVESWKELYIK